MAWLKPLICKLWTMICRNKTASFFIENCKYMKESFGQLVAVWVISNIPLLLLIAFSIFRVKDGNYAAISTKVVVDVFIPSTMVFYVAALMAPLIWVFIDCFGKRTWVPLFKTFSAAIIFMMIVLTAILYLDATSELNNKKLVDTTFTVFYVAAILIWYFSIFYSKVLEAATPSITSDSPDDILDELNSEANND